MTAAAVWFQKIDRLSPLERNPITIRVIFLLWLASAPLIRDVTVHGNQRTTAQTVLAIAGLHVGEPLEPGLVDSARDKLIDSGLFSEVDIRTEPLPDGASIDIVARDKTDWFIAPMASISSYNSGGGVAFGHSNLLGENKRLIGFGTLGTGESRLFLAYQDPSILGSRFYGRVDANVVRQREDEFHPEELDLLRRTQTWIGYAGIQIGRALPNHFHLHGYYRFAAIGFETPSQFGPPAPDGKAATLRIVLGYDTLLNLDVVEEGTDLEGAFEFANAALGSDFEYLRAEAKGRRAFRFGREHNLVVRGGIHFAIDPPFTEEWEGGGVLLRGFQLRQFRGDSALDGHIEHFFPIAWMFSHRVALRGVVFFDSMAIWFRDLGSAVPRPDGTYLVRHGDGSFRDFVVLPEQKLTRDNWHNSLGTGLRVHLHNVAVPVVGVDVGWGLEANEVQVFFSIGDTGS